jgi:hypothetical protein
MDTDTDSNKYIILLLLLLIFFIIIGYVISTQTSPAPQGPTPAPAPAPTTALPALAPTPAPAPAPTAALPAPAPILQVLSSVKTNSSTNSINTNDTSSKTNFTLKLKETDHSKGNSTEINCTVNNGPIYKCSNPIDNDSYITLKNGPIFSISKSDETDLFKNTTQNYYIIGAYSFLVDGIVNVSSDEITINSVNDLNNFFNNIENEFQSVTYTYKKKDVVITSSKGLLFCQNLPEAFRIESPEPYNTTCIFFPGLKIDVIVKVLEKSFLPYLQQTVLNDYYNVLTTKISIFKELTIIEYCMYLAMLNKIKKSNFKYYLQCTSDDPNIYC